MQRTNPYPQLTLTPLEFERHVREMLDAMGGSLSEFHSKHREAVEGADGEYEIDVTARFTALGMDFLVLVECKHHKNSIKREVLQALLSKMQSVGAQKGAVFSTSGFQSGALAFAEAHGIATVRLEDGRSSYFTKSLGDERVEPAPWMGIPSVVGWLLQGNRTCLVSKVHGEYLAEALGIEGRQKSP